MRAHLNALPQHRRQPARNADHRGTFQPLGRTYGHWKVTGEIIDPDTGAVLETGPSRLVQQALEDFGVGCFIAVRQTSSSKGFTEISNGFRMFSGTNLVCSGPLNERSGESWL